MNDDLELCQVIYDVLKTQIQFGAYRFGDILPTMENATDNFLVSLDTVRSAYLRLQREGYLTLSTNVGSMVVKDYSKQEIELNIQLFFSQRKSALIDLSKALRPLLGYAQWMGLKKAPAKIYTNMQQLKDANGLTPFTAFNHIMKAYDSLGNDLLLRLLWRFFMFFEAPFFIVPHNPWYTLAVREYSPRTLDYCLSGDWDSLRSVIYDSQDSLPQTVCQFYKDRITTPPPLQEISFTWSSYKKASQIYYSLAMDLLISISRGQYPADTFLPSLSKLSKERHVSVSTVRRSLSLLNGIGATKSIKRIGTRVLPAHETAENCDFKKPAVRKRLLDMAQSMQILTLSCRGVSQVTISALDTVGTQRCIEQLTLIKRLGQYELLTYATLDLMKQFAPYQAVHTVYTELLQQLFWGYPLQNLWKKNDDKIKFYISCFDSFICSLEEADAIGFSEKLERLMVHEFQFTIKNLIQLGIREAEKLLLDL